jgi:hypothetical protein
MPFKMPEIPFKVPLGNAFTFHQLELAAMNMAATKTASAGIFSQWRRTFRPSLATTRAKILWPQPSRSVYCAMF